MVAKVMVEVYLVMEVASKMDLLAMAQVQVLDMIIIIVREVAIMEEVN